MFSINNNENKGDKRQEKHIAINEENDGNAVALKSIKTISSSSRITKTTDNGTGKLEVGDFSFK